MQPAIRALSVLLPALLFAFAFTVDAKASGHDSVDVAEGTALDEVIADAANAIAGAVKEVTRGHVVSDAPDVLSGETAVLPDVSVAHVLDEAAVQGIANDPIDLGDVFDDTTVADVVGGTAIGTLVDDASGITDTTGSPRLDELLNATDSLPEDVLPDDVGGIGLDRLLDALDGVSNVLDDGTSADDLTVALTGLLQDELVRGLDAVNLDVTVVRHGSQTLELGIPGTLAENGILNGGVVNVDRDDGTLAGVGATEVLVRLPVGGVTIDVTAALDDRAVTIDVPATLGDAGVGIDNASVTDSHAGDTRSENGALADLPTEALPAGPSLLEDVLTNPAGDPAPNNDALLIEDAAITDPLTQTVDSRTGDRRAAIPTTDRNPITSLRTVNHGRVDRTSSRFRLAPSAALPLAVAFMRVRPSSSATSAAFAGASGRNRAHPIVPRVRGPTRAPPTSTPST